MKTIKKSAKIKTVKAALKKGDACPQCGKPLQAGGEYADAWCTRPAGCGALYGHRAAPPMKWGKAEDTFIEAVKKWLAASPDRSEIKILIADPIRLYEVCGYAPAAWEKAIEIMNEYLLTWESKVVAKTLAPYVKKLNEANTPPSKRAKHENIQRLFDDSPGNKSDKWLTVADRVFRVAIEQSKRPLQQRESDYQTVTQLKHLIKELSAPTANHAEIKATLAKNFQRYMNEKSTKRKTA